MILEQYFDKKRNIFFKANMRIHWFEYSRDGIVIHGGFGTIINLEPLREKYTWDQDICILEILCDDGKLRELPHTDVDILEDWDK